MGENRCHKRYEKNIVKKIATLVGKEEITKYIYLWADILSPSHNRIKVFVEKVK